MLQESRKVVYNKRIPFALHFASTLNRSENRKFERHVRKHSSMCLKEINKYVEKEEFFKFPNCINNSKNGKKPYLESGISEKAFGADAKSFQHVLQLFCDSVKTKGNNEWKKLLYFMGKCSKKNGSYIINKEQNNSFGKNQNGTFNPKETWREFMSTWNSETINLFFSILQNKDKISKVVDIVKTLMLKVPKGFERFERFDKDENKKWNKPEEEKNKKFDNSFFYIFFFFLLLFFLFVDSNALYNEITQNEFFYNYLSKGYVEKIKLVNKDYVKAYLNVHGIKKHNLKYVCFRIGNSDSFERKVEEIQKHMNIRKEELLEVQYSNEGNVLNEIKSYIPSILFFLLFIFLLQKITLKNVAGGGMDKLFKFSKITPINSKSGFKTDVKFENVAGMKQAKQEIMEFVDFLKNPSKYEILGAKIPKGALLCGAPGTGKTLLAKAVAGEANVPFFNISGSDFIEVFVGIGPSRVRELFAQARKYAPSIIFIDEIDAVGRKRSKGGFAGGGNDERENTLNQMLVEMDGFNTNNNKVVVLAGTNRVDILDPAITRPGRFDRIVNISKPDITERSEIFQVHLKNLKLHESLDIKNISYILASLTPGFVGADIANVVNEGAIQSARRSNVAGVEIRDFETAIERIIGGLPKTSSLISPLEKKIIAYHETGHALTGWFLENADPVLKVSIIPRNNGALGYSQHLSEELMLFSREGILDRLAVILGGRASEELFIGNITTGAIDDLNKVTQLAYSFVSQYGMNKEIGLVSFQPNANTEYNLYRPHSECLAHLIDSEVRNLIEDQYNRVKQLLLKNEKHVHNLANLLYEKETVSYHDIVKCVGERPHPVKSNYEMFVKASPYKLIPEGKKTSAKKEAVISETYTTEKKESTDIREGNDNNDSKDNSDIKDNSEDNGSNRTYINNDNNQENNAQSSNSNGSTIKESMEIKEQNEKDKIEKSKIKKGIEMDQIKNIQYSKMI